MRLIADSRGRLTSAELFTPGAAYEASRTGDGAIVLRKLVPEQRRVKYAKVKRKNGRLVVEWPAGCQVVEGAIEQAVREERDSR